MKSVDNKILAEVKNAEEGNVFLSSNFATYGKAESERKVLERLVESQTLLRLARGIYLYQKNCVVEKKSISLYQGLAHIYAIFVPKYKEE